MRFLPNNDILKAFKNGSKFIKVRHGNGFVTRFFKDEIDFKDGIGKLHNLTKASRILTLT